MDVGPTRTRVLDQSNYRLIRNGKGGVGWVC